MLGNIGLGEILILVITVGIPLFWVWLVVKALRRPR